MVHRSPTESAARKRARAEYKKAWHQRNRARLRLWQREYRQRNRERIAAQRAAAYRLNRARILADQKRRREAADAATVSARRRAAYQRNRLQVLASQRAAYERHPEKHRAAKATYRGRNREVLRIKQREYVARKREEVYRRNRDRARTAYATDPRRRAYLRQWAKDHPEKTRKYGKSSWHSRRGAEGAGFTSAEWEALLVAQHHRCAYCGAVSQLHADHRVPIARGGRNEIANILPACGPCNRRKHTRSEADFRALLAAGAWPDQSRSPDRSASHSRNASNVNGLPRKSRTRAVAALVPPAAKTRSR